MNKIRITSAIFLISLLTGCGGGASSSGGEQVNNNVTACIAVEEVLIGTSFAPTTGQKFTNNCGFVVNFAVAFTSILPESIKVLQINESIIADPAFYRAFVACRAPSVPIDLNSGTQVDLSCSG